MLVLQRSVGQRVQIGPDIVVTVLECARGRVRVGVEAPAGAIVRRDELKSEEQLERPPRHKAGTPD